MANATGATLQTIIYIAIFVAATVSLLSIWSDEWFDLG